MPELRLPLFLALPLLAAPSLAFQEPAHRETPDDPPALFRAQDDPSARSAGASFLLGSALSVQVNVDANGQNVLGDAANEPSIAVDPTNPDRIVIGWRQFDSVMSNFRQAGWAYTTDGGASWTFPGVLTPGFFRSDPSLGFDNQGNLYYQSLDGSFLCQFFTSTDGGESWGQPVDAFGGDKNWMAVDRSGGTGDGNVYGIWQRFFSCCDPDTFTRSQNGAQSFESPLEIPRYPSFGTLAVGPDGEVYAVGIDASFGQDLDTIVVARSTDADEPGTPSFDTVIVDLGGSLRVSAGPNPAGLLGQMNVAVDRSDGPSRGNVYVVGSVDPPGDPLDVFLIRSTNGGSSWSAPVRVNDDPPGSGRWQWFAAVDVAPNGRIDVVWFDTRNSGQSDVSELFYAWSYDEGQSWMGNEPVSPPFDSHIGWPNQDKLGDYITVVSNEVGANVAYPATFNGEQDVYFVRLFPDCTLGGPGTPFCFGDGTGTPCPCGNTGAPGHGCASGANGEGARLSACGVASAAAGNLQLVASGAVPGQVGLFFQGDTALNGGDGAPFRDGLRCTGSPTIRLEVVDADFTGSSQSTVSVAQAGNVQAGQTKHYQLWYRDPSSSPCGTGSNLSNGYTVTWAP